MIISYEKPPIWKEASALFNLKEDQGVVFTYGNVIFNPSKVVIPPDLIRHEETHAEQQEGHEDVANLWWQRYLRDTDFRIDQEAQAYGKQYDFICQSIKDRNERYRILMNLASMLAGPVYGKAISQNDAKLQIRAYSSYS